MIKLMIFNVLCLKQYVDAIDNKTICVDFIQNFRHTFNQCRFNRQYDLSIFNYFFDIQPLCVDSISIYKEA